jgi:hypothetical protein
MEMNDDSPGRGESGFTGSPEPGDDGGSPEAREDATAEGAGVPVDAPWLRQRGEDERKLDAATAYFELGPTRKLNVLPRMGEWASYELRAWRQRHRWDERAKAFDEYRARNAREGEPAAQQGDMQSGDVGSLAGGGSRPEVGTDAVGRAARGDSRARVESIRLDAKDGQNDSRSADGPDEGAHRAGRGAADREGVGTGPSRRRVAPQEVGFERSHEGTFIGI